MSTEEKPEPAPIIINGKTYPLWQQFIDRKEEWIGGTLKDDDCEESTTIVDISLRPNGEDSAYFEIHGISYNCAFDVHYGGIGGDPEGGKGLHFQFRFGGGFTIWNKEESK